MKVKVLQKFRDNKLKCIHNEDDVIEISKERYEKLNSISPDLVETIEEETINFDSMTKKEIVKFAEEKGIDLNMRMTKKEMVEELS
jgi:ribosomal protein L9